VDPMSLYPPVELPVSPSTPMLSSLVQWDHTDSWPVPTMADFAGVGGSGSAGSYTSSVEVDLSSPDSEYAYLSGYAIDGRAMIPASFFLVLAWQQLARMNGQIYQQTAVCFEDVRIHQGAVLPTTGKTVCCIHDVLTVNFDLGFEVLGQWNAIRCVMFFIMSPLRRHIFVCFTAKSAFWRGFSALAPYTGVGPI